MMGSFHLCLLILLWLAGGPFLTDTTASMKILRNFTPSTETAPWRAQNDGVMGGVSTGQATIFEEQLLFSGKISLENYGGFAQIYSPVDEGDFFPYTNLRLRLQGDGRTYQFRLATDAEYRGGRIAYKSTFPTQAGQWMEVSIPLSTFTPSYRGRDLSGPALDLTAIERMGFLLADGQAGEFSLLVDWIGLE
ncbi:MAG: CIA30 family protein [Opitutales bacterium]|nr:CIA30 family protein [Opitutales bacterium]